jgi:hypothetical protein
VRGLFFLWRVCGFAFLKLPTLGREPATKRNYRNTCIPPRMGDPPLAPSPNIGASLFGVVAATADLALTEAALRARRDRLARMLVADRSAQKPASRLNQWLQGRLGIAASEHGGAEDPLYDLGIRL